MDSLEMYKILEDNLEASNTLQRKDWVHRICGEDIDLMELAPLLFEKPSLSSRFLWLLSDIALVKPKKIHAFLPYLLDNRSKIKYKKYAISIANQFKMVGVPVEMESKAIDLLYQWIRSSETDVTTKSRSIDALTVLVLKYPDLCDEFIICLEDQQDLNSTTYQNKIKKILNSVM